MKKYSILLVFAVFGLFTSCSGDKSSTAIDKEQTTLTGDIKIDGSSTVYPITEAIAEEFRNEAPKVKVTIGVSGTGGGFKKFGRGETDISDASRSIKDSEAKICEENGMKYVQLSVAYDGIAVVGHPDNDWVENMTLAELKTIWEPDAQGKVMNWNNVNSSYPNHKMSLLGPGTASGTFDYFTKAIVGKSGSSRGDYMPSEDDHVLVQGVAGDKHALGFFGLAYYEENKDKLKLIGVDPGTGAVKPSLETVANGSYSPLSRPIFIYVSSEAVKKPQVVEFVRYYLKNAKELVSDVGYIPLLDEEYITELNKFEEFFNSLNQ
jgi:phosphate transport system substrate-binding protein